MDESLCDRRRGDQQVTLLRSGLTRVGRCDSKGVSGYCFVGRPLGGHVRGVALANDRLWLAQAAATAGPRHEGVDPAIAVKHRKISLIKPLRQFLKRNSGSDVGRGVLLSPFFRVLIRDIKDGTIVARIPTRSDGTFLRSLTLLPTRWTATTGTAPTGIGTLEAPTVASTPGCATAVSTRTPFRVWKTECSQRYSISKLVKWSKPTRPKVGHPKDRKQQHCARFEIP